MFVLLLSSHYMFYFYRADFQLKLSELTQVFRDAKKAYVSTSTRISFISLRLGEVILLFKVLLYCTLCTRVTIHHFNVN